jgi:hypothetical protein
MRTKLLFGVVVAGLLVVVGVSYAVSRSRRVQPARDNPSGTLTGRVLTPDGLPMPGASVYALSQERPMGRLPMSPTDGQGEFRFDDLIPGKYVLSASKEDEGYAPSDSTFHSGGSTQPPEVTIFDGQTTAGVTVYLGPKAARLIGHIVDVATNKPIKNPQGLQMTLRRMDDPESLFITGPDLDGEYSILVPPVPITIEVSAPGREKKRIGPLQLTKEEIRRLDIPLRAAK